MAFDNNQPLDGADVPISSVYSPENNTFTALRGEPGAYIDEFGNASSAAVMSFIQPRVVQRALAVTGGESASLECSFSADNTGGNSIVLCVGAGVVEENGTTLVISDTQGNTYTQVAKAEQGTTLESSIYLSTGIRRGANRVTVTIIGQSVIFTALSMKAYEVSGLIASVDALDQFATGASSDGLINPSTHSFMPLVPNEMAFSAVATKEIVTISPDTGWSSNDGTLFPWGGNLGSFDSQYRALSTMAQLSPQASLSLPSSWVMAVASFRSIIVPVAGVFQLAGILSGIVQANQIPVSNAAPQGPLAVTGSLIDGQDNLINFSGVARRLRIQNESGGTIYWRTDAVASVDSPSLGPPGSNAIIVEWLSVQCSILHIFIPKGGTTKFNVSGGVKIEAYA